MKDSLMIHEVGLRDGIQMESTFISTENKWRLSRALAEAGLKRIELGSFVSPRAVPQMADAAELFSKARSSRNLSHSALVVNEKGYERALEAGVHSVAAVLVPSETLSLRNSRKTVDQALEFVDSLLSRSRKDGVWTRVYLAVAWVCPFEGPISF